jgi:hypothetical protein
VKLTNHLFILLALTLPAPVTAWAAERNTPERLGRHLFFDQRLSPGEKIGLPAADQAKAPFVHPLGHNLNRGEMGNPGLTDEEEKAVVAFMKTLSDGSRPANWPCRIAIRGSPSGESIPASAGGNKPGHKNFRGAGLHRGPLFGSGEWSGPCWRAAHIRCA